MKKDGLIYFIGGINGSGKSSIINAISERNREFESYHGSVRFMEWLKIKPGDYPSLWKLSDDFKNVELDKMIRFAVNERAKSSRSLLIDGHYLNLRNGEVSNATGDWISVMDAIFLISADSREIFERLENDFRISGRERGIFREGAGEKEMISEIDRYQNLSRQRVIELSRIYKIPYYEIVNNDGNQENAVDKFISIHTNLRNHYSH